MAGKRIEFVDQIHNNWGYPEGKALTDLMGRDDFLADKITGEKIDSVKDASVVYVHDGFTKDGMIKTVGILVRNDNVRALLVKLNEDPQIKFSNHEARRLGDVLDYQHERYKQVQAALEAPIGKMKPVEFLENLHEEIQALVGELSPKALKAFQRNAKKFQEEWEKYTLEVEIPTAKVFGETFHEFLIKEFVKKGRKKEIPRLPAVAVSRYRHGDQEVALVLNSDVQYVHHFNKMNSGRKFRIHQIAGYMMFLQWKLAEQKPVSKSALKHDKIRQGLEAAFGLGNKK